jgi:hypothetical protein
LRVRRKRPHHHRLRRDGQDGLVPGHHPSSRCHEATTTDITSSTTVTECTGSHTREHGAF